MDRDFLAWLVDISTVIVGVVTAVALGLTVLALRSERRRHEAVMGAEHARHEEAWRRQLALDHHARIYEAAAEMITAMTAFSRRAEARVQARGSASIDHGFASDADEATDFMYAAFLDSRGGPVTAIVESLDSANSARHRLYFLIPNSGDGQTLLNDLIVIEHVLAAVRPAPGHDSGRGDLGSVLDSFGVRQAVENLVSTERLTPGDPMARLRFVRDLGDRYFLGRIGRFVEPPPLARLST